MYKQASIEQELLQSMEKFFSLNKNASVIKINKLEEAVEYLHAAATVFDAAGLVNEATDITKIINELVK